jgi:hypothetical protein
MTGGHAPFTLLPPRDRNSSMTRFATPRAPPLPPLELRRISGKREGSVAGEGPREREEQGGGGPLVGEGVAEAKPDRIS